MSYTISTWTTLAVARVKADYVVVFINARGKQCGRDASMLLTQTNDATGARRTILGVVAMDTCEVLPAPDLPGYVGVVDSARWAATRRIPLQKTATANAGGHAGASPLGKSTDHGDFAPTCDDAAAGQTPQQIGPNDFNGGD